MQKITFLATALAGVLLAAGPALAKDAVCYTTDDGKYDCTFVSLDKSGSFEISAPGKPTFSVWIDQPGVATAGAVFERGGRSVPLPGTYHRNQADGACWDNDDTGTQICAW